MNFSLQTLVLIFALLSVCIGAVTTTNSIVTLSTSLALYFAIASSLSSALICRSQVRQFWIVYAVSTVFFLVLIRCDNSPLLLLTYRIQISSCQYWHMGRIAKFAYLQPQLCTVTLYNLPSFNGTGFGRNDAGVRQFQRLSRKRRITSIWPLWSSSAYRCCGKNL